MKNSSVINIAKAMQGAFLPKNVSDEVFQDWSDKPFEQLEFYGKSHDKKNMGKDAALFKHTFKKILDDSKFLQVSSRELQSRRINCYPYIL